MDVLSVLVLFVVLATVYYFIRVLQRPKNLPPSPPGWPILGNLPELVSNPPKKVTQWNRKYGSTIAVYLGQKRQVFMSDFDTVKSVFHDENTTGRDPNFVLVKLLNGKGFLASEGELWREHRRFALSTLRDLGMGKSWMEDAMLEEINELIEIYRSYKGRPVNPRAHLTLAVSNVICAMVFGQRFEHSDERFQHLCGLFANNLALLGKILPIQIYPFLKYVPGFFASSWNKLINNIAEIKGFVRELVNQHNKQKNAALDEKNPDFIDHFLAEQEKQKNDPNSTFNDEQLMASVLQLFAAGTETSTSTLLWTFIYMVENPDVLAKIHAEIDSEIGRERSVRMSDKGSKAALLDVQRLASVVALGISHTNFAPMKIEGYDIPSRTVLNTNAYCMHRDPKYWKHPDRLYPEHFLGPDGSVIIPKGFIPFGIGKRACLGESLAKMNIHLFFTNIAQKFDIKRAPDSELSSKKFIVSLARLPAPFEICFVPRP